MDRIAVRCWLDWWASSAMNFGGSEANVYITSSSDGWHAHGDLDDASDEAREGFAFLCDADPVFSLRFEDESTITVNVHLHDDHSTFTLTEYTGQTEE